eukprot:TRINITY_DN19772_c0_g1_i1.p1 TRINITY_DN19772_c0_g1~~TRINITY_DN19772_c0_g1_i1.p1  ORF type:complete len:671 (+),score=159.02 TRINITY_DN19772_c0_g1_i1:83-2095(+)
MPRPVTPALPAGGAARQASSGRLPRSPASASPPGALPWPAQSSSPHRSPPPGSLLSDARRDRALPPGSHSPARGSARGQPAAGGSCVSVVHNGTEYRLRNLALTERTVADMQRVLAAKTGTPAEQQRLWVRGVGAPLPSGKHATQVTLYQAGLRDGSIVRLEVLPALTVLADCGDGGPVIELRLRGVRTREALVAELRRVAAQRMGIPVGDVALFAGDSAQPLEDGGGATLAEAGIHSGDTVRATRRGGTHGASPRRPPTSPKEAAADRRRGASPDSAPGSVHVASSWPPGCGVHSALEGLQLLTDGLWTSDGALCRGGRAPPGARGPRAQGLTVLPLPAMHGEATVRDLRGVIAELLGVNQRSQLLFVRGRPLPAAGSRAEAGALQERGVASGAEIQLAIDRSAAAADTAQCTATPLPLSPTGGDAPWCVHCIVIAPVPSSELGAGGHQQGQLRPQFCQPTWRVGDLIEVAAQDCGEHAGLGSLYHRGRELALADTVHGSGLGDGAACLLVFRATLDVAVELLPAGAACGDGQTALLKGVPRDASVAELCSRAAAAAELPGAAAAAARGDLRCSLHGVPLHNRTSVRDAGIAHGDCVRCVVEPSAQPPPPAPWPPPAEGGALRRAVFTPQQRSPPRGFDLLAPPLFVSAPLAAIPPGGAEGASSPYRPR